MSPYLIELLSSIESNGLYAMLAEIIVIDDGSTDDTVKRVESWTASADRRKITRLHSLPENRGRFFARYEGARIAKTKFILFLDTRIQIPEEFGSRLAEFLSLHEAVMGSLKINTEKSVFSLYWERSHAFLFKNTYEKERHGVLVTFENYHQHVSGTTVLGCRRDYFMRACEPFLGAGLIADDTGLLLHLAKLSPIYRNSRLFVSWEPRQSAKEFLKYLFVHRGTTFADYHVYEKWGKWTALFFLAFVILVADIAFLFWLPAVGVINICAQLIFLLCSVALFSRSPREFFRLAPLHAGVVLSYGFGAIFGVFNVGMQRLRRRLRNTEQPL